MSAPVVPPLRKLKRAHEELMREYVRAQRDVAELGAIGSHGLRTLVSYFVEGQILKQLQRITSAYVGLEQAVGAPADDPRRAWIGDARERCERHMAVLKNVRRTLAVLSPAAIIPLTATFLRIPIHPARWVGLTVDPHIRFTAFVVLGVAMFYVGVYFSLFAVLAFRKKRQILYPNAPAERVWTRGRTRRPGANVYALEDRLFRLLPTRKRRESRADIYAQLAAGAAVTWAYVYVSVRKSDVTAAISLLPLVVVSVGLTIDALVRLARRRER